MIKLNQKLLRQNISRIDMSDATTAILNEHSINTLEDLCQNSKTDLKKINIGQDEVSKIDIELQLIGLRLRNSL